MAERWYLERGFVHFQGRGLFARQPIEAGTVLFEESPLVSSQFCWNAAYGYLACEYCLRPLETAECNVRRLASDFAIDLPYPECCSVQEQLERHTRCADCGTLYCSQACLNDALERYHKGLCLGANKDNASHPVNALIDFWK